MDANNNGVNPVPLQRKLSHKPSSAAVNQGYQYQPQSMYQIPVGDTAVQNAMPVQQKRLRKKQSDQYIQPSSASFYVEPAPQYEYGIPPAGPPQPYGYQPVPLPFQKV